MVYVCAELTGIGLGENGSTSLYEYPQRWIVEYDRSMMGNNYSQRLMPGVYMPFMAVENDGNPYYGEYREGPNDARYYVTADSLVRVYRDHTAKQWDYYHSNAQTVREKVDWKWESWNGVGAPQTERARQLHESLKETLKFLEGTVNEDLLNDENWLLQPLDKGTCIVLANDELYLIQSDYGKCGYGHIHYVTRLDDFGSIYF
jgi:hypothetical protein